MAGVAPSSVGLSRSTALFIAATAGTLVGAATWWIFSSDARVRGAFDWDRAAAPEVSDAELALLSTYTGTSDLKALRARLLRWWRAVKRRVHVYKCIQEMMFLTSRIDQHKAYAALLQRATEPPKGSGHGAKGAATPGLRVADVGCCFGQDTRRMLLDGVPASSIWAIDLVPDYWEASKELWGDVGPTSRAAGVNTLFGDMAAVPKTPSAVDLEGQQHLLGTFDFVSAMAVLHVLNKEQCERFLSRCLSMLVPGRGVFFGHCVGTTEEDGATWAARSVGAAAGGPMPTRFLHSTATLAKTMTALGFVDVEVKPFERSVLRFNRAGPGQEEPDSGPKKQMLSFSGRRP